MNQQFREAALFNPRNYDTVKNIMTKLDPGGEVLQKTEDNIKVVSLQADQSYIDRKLLFFPIILKELQEGKVIVRGKHS